MSLIVFITLLAIALPVIGLVYFFYRGLWQKHWPKQALLTLPTGIALFIAAGLLFSANQAVKDPPKTASRQETLFEKNNTAASSSTTPGSASQSTDTSSAKTNEHHSASTSKSMTPSADAVEKARQDAIAHIPTVPDDKDFVRINDNIPFFTNEDLTQTEPYADYGRLDARGRVTTANALLDESLMPPEERGSMDGSIKPTGWQQKRYANVPGSWLYNRSHLIGYQLAGSENDEKNLMTGTRWFNVEGMLPFENFVAHYIESTGNHVRYRITPVFEGNNLLATGIFMEGFSIEDNGEGLCFNIFVPNRQPGITIDYATGKSHQN
ncbi:MAG: DNA/RNA non-specific endonuclease [Aerococcus sp.]|nr:DNA/RNA non-specific endonuclease [Aerococcus sp.]